MKRVKKPLLVVTALFLLMALVSCGGKSSDGVADPDATAKEDGKGAIAEKMILPEVDEFDPGMSQAHFISAPYSDNDNDTGITEYEISYEMTIDNTDACFVIGDARGEFGDLILCSISDHGSSDEADGIHRGTFSLKHFQNGLADHGFNESEFEIEGRDSGVYSVELSVKGQELSAIVNSVDIADFEIPGFDLGCVGTYKSRGSSYAYIDNIVVSSNGKTLFSDDFDGDFENNLFEYNYENEQTGAFSPWHVNVTPVANGAETGEEANNKLRVSSGFVLSETKAQPAPVFVRDFDCRVKELDKAYLYMTALGSFEASINGTTVSDSFFDPGKMVYDTYLNYIAIDVTQLLQEHNTFNIALFHGFFDRGNGYPETASRWGKETALKGEIVLTYKDGTKDIIPTDDEFFVYTNSRYRFADIYQGEVIDDRYETSDKEKVLVDNVDESFLALPLLPKENESVKAVEVRDYVSVSEPVKGHFVYDFGQNFAGTVTFDPAELRKSGLKEGSAVTFRYGELTNSEQMVNADGPVGTVWTANLFTARATDRYVVGKEEEATQGKDESVTFAHTYHGFRYVEVTGLDKALSNDSFKALVLSSGMDKTGEFSCSSDIINRLYSNSGYSTRSNFIDVPTDCSQRDERLGWAGDAQAVSLFAIYQYDAENFYKNYLRAMRSEQSEDGCFMDVAPFNTRFGGHSCWGDAPVVIAWNLYLQYGDKKVLEDNYDSLCKWIDYLVNTSDDYLMTSGGYADHLSGQDTIEALTDTAWCAHSARIVSKMGEALGKEDDAEKYAKVADSFTQKWQQTYIRQDWSVGAGILADGAESETAYSLGIAFDLFPEDIMDGAKERLKLLTEYGGFLFYPGYSGMPYYLPSLAEGGYADIAVKVLENTQMGGIAFPLSMGLTTNPEELNAFKYTDEAGNSYEDGRYRVSGSLNHAAYSSVCSFLFTDILGIKPDEKQPGFEHFFIEPAVNSGLEYASGSYRSGHGTIRVSWNAAEKKIEGEIPEGTTCTVILPGDRSEELEAGIFVASW
ncbi:MAG: hypothetical protein E7306_03815 [Butyrivibrio sp.]|nr:hypothetical protein [Butyrivibrio sp.]